MLWSPKVFGRRLFFLFFFFLRLRGDLKKTLRVPAFCSFSLTCVSPSIIWYSVVYLSFVRAFLSIWFHKMTSLTGEIFFLSLRALRVMTKKKSTYFLSTRSEFSGDPNPFSLDVTINKILTWNVPFKCGKKKLLIYREQAWQRVFIGLWSVRINLQTQ